jgi:hypothetical protein
MKERYSILRNEVKMPPKKKIPEIKKWSKQVTEKSIRIGYPCCSFRKAG